MVNDVALWFAKDKNNEIVIINDAKYGDEYNCPICGSDVIPKAIKEDSLVQSHFAHIDKSKCTSESMIHFWFKHKLLKVGEKFTIHTDKNYEFICSKYEIEKVYDTPFGKYNPDVTVHTKCGKIIYFEISHTNEKKVDDYIEKWKYLNNIVVQIETKDLMNMSSNRNVVFKSLYYEGKLYNKNDVTRSQIRRLVKNKLGLSQYWISKRKDIIDKFDWFFLSFATSFSIENFNINLKNIYFNNNSDFNIVCKILKKIHCFNILNYDLDEAINSIINEGKDMVRSELRSLNEAYTKNCIYINKIKETIDNSGIKQKMYDTYNKYITSPYYPNPPSCRFTYSSEWFKSKLESEFNAIISNYSLFEMSKIKEKILSPTVEIKYLHYDENRKDFIELEKSMFITNDLDVDVANIIKKLEKVYLYNGSILENNYFLKKDILKLCNKLPKIKYSYRISAKHYNYIDIDWRIQIKNIKNTYEFYFRDALYKSVDSEHLYIGFCNFLKMEYIDMEKCVECGDDINLSIYEYLWFESKDLKIPKRCKRCRKQIKTNETKQGQVSLYHK